MACLAVLPTKFLVILLWGHKWCEWNLILVHEILIILLEAHFAVSCLVLNSRPHYGEQNVADTCCASSVGFPLPRTSRKLRPTPGSSIILFHWNAMHAAYVPGHFLITMLRWVQTQVKINWSNILSFTQFVQIAFNMYHHKNSKWSILHHLFSCCFWNEVFIFNFQPTSCRWGTVWTLVAMCAQRGS